LALRHDTPTWELRSNLRLLAVNLLNREPANKKILLIRLPPGSRAG
jgi:hypothetical protein